MRDELVQCCRAWTGRLAKGQDAAPHPKHIRRQGLHRERGKPFLAVFADTGNEAPETYSYIKNLPKATGGPPIVWVRADFSHKFRKHRIKLNERWAAEGISSHKIKQALAAKQPTGNPFQDLTLLKSRFPSTKARFCTEELKIKPIRENMFKPVWDTGRGVISWQGVRREESRARSLLPKFQRMQDPGGKLVVYRPLIDWSLSDVWAIISRHNIKPNPLYAQGFKRVGCFPCIMSRKAEVRKIAEKYPEQIERIAAWEAKVTEASKHSMSTFFPVAGRVGRAGGIHHTTHGIHEVVKWSKTSRGGRQYTLTPQDESEAEFGTACHEWGVCE